MKVAKLLVVLVITALVLSLALPVAAAPPADNPGKGPPEIGKIVFVHYPKGMPAKGGIPGPPEGKEENGGKLWYKYSGIHWASSDLPVGYLVNLNGVADPDDKPAFLGGIQAGFETWDSASDPYAVSYSGPTDLVPGNSEAEWDETNGQYVGAKNVVGWKALDYPNAIAVAYIWYLTLTEEIVEVDMAMNSDPYFAWWQIEVGTADPDTYAWGTPDTEAPYNVDVQNIVTHEAGHWLMLGDLYNKPANDQTMYGRSAEFDLQKRSLESGDEAGIQEIYPGT